VSFFVKILDVRTSLSGSVYITHFNTIKYKNRLIYVYIYYI